MLENGESQKARFYFPAFRFIEQQNQTISTYYLHCIIRLCEPSTCSTFKVGWSDLRASHLNVHVISCCSCLIHSNATGRGGVWRPRLSRGGSQTPLCSRCQLRPRQTRVCGLIQISAQRSSRTKLAASFYAETAIYREKYNSACRNRLALASSVFTQ